MCIHWSRVLYPAIAVLSTFQVALGSSEVAAMHTTSQSKAQQLLRAEVSGSLKLHRAELPLSPTNQDDRQMVVMVMFDHRYLGVWECWRDYWIEFSSKSGHNLEIVVYDPEAEDSIAKWKKKHPTVKFKLRRVLSDDFGDPDDIGSMLNSSHFRDLIVSSTQESLESRWDSAVYEANFWRQIKARLDEGKDVLHMDVDAIPVGNLWTPVERILRNLTDVDIITPGALTNEIQYIMFRNTVAAKEVVDYHHKEWDEYLKRSLAAKGNDKAQLAAISRPKEPQMALAAYQDKYPCTKGPYQDFNNTYQVGYSECKTHSNRNVRIAYTNGVTQNSACVKLYASELDPMYAKNPLCQDTGVFVDHGRNNLDSHCPLPRYTYTFGDMKFPRSHAVTS